MTGQAPPAGPDPQPDERFEEGEEAPPPGVRIMAIVRWSLVAAMASAALASFVYVFADPGAAQVNPSSPVYYCPMHPSVVQDHPGQCPICSMSLVRKEPPKDAPAPKRAGLADAGTDATSVRPAAREKHGSAEAHAHALPPEVVPLDLSEQRVQLIGMRTARVVRAPVAPQLRTVGYVAPTESGLASVQTRFSGWIQELHVRETGQPVKRGQLLARAYSPELLAAQQELLNAKRWVGEPSGATQPAGAPSSLLASAQSRLALLGMDPKEIAEVERSGELHRLIEIRSPASGYISQKNVLEGLYVQPGTQLFEIADLSKVWVIAEIFEHDAGRVRVGQRATLELTAYPGESFPGRLQFLYPALDVNTRTLRARIEFKNPGLRLRPGMYGDLVLEAPAASGLMIPREAVVDTGTHQYVFVARGGGHFEPRAVRVGARSEAGVQVLDGLAEGETVVTTGNFLIDSESRLRSTIEGKR
jgi:membrane fusion protein, copper/silver efflux system